ncbi:MAG: GNAT family N-acetyltransferase [Mongoliibacter sp.]|uniref:GNAT family N-acetyltransferase n=1 Tax=Mongoliibacter sp. TaxID=2022438 RepID=UPI0012F1EC3C|nr:GNAT family N-acetyltransferase [Mongoliibacter sp.]TVP51441.1 MAG: GNAT family N-acetyltransferase [Mongoliibacter sp.]
MNYDFIIKTSDTEEELQGILQLQAVNHANSLTSVADGFVTVRHHLEDLKKMNAIAPHIIVKDGPKIVVYILAMTSECKEDIPVLKPMFEQFDQILYKGSNVSDYQYIVIGQVCVDQDYRGKGLLDLAYAFYKETHKGNFHFGITEIATRNQRSIRAHQRIGFKEIHQFTDSLPENWSIVLWDWS